MRLAIIGAGIVGLAATHELLRRGHDVTCFEAGQPMGARSAGSSRIFRLAHADPALVDYAIRARRKWTEWESQFGVRLIGDQGTVVTGPRAPAWGEAMRAAGADCHFVDHNPGLPAASVPEPTLVDPAGGVIDVRTTGALLRKAVGLALRTATVWGIDAGRDHVTLATSIGHHEYDYLIIAAGRGTCALAEQVGVYTPSALVHHVRFTFPLREPTSPPCWLDDSEAWRPGFTSYQHQSGPGQWSIGGHFGDDAVAWELGPVEVAARSREIVTRYVREALVGVDDTVLEELHCDHTPGLGDGVHLQHGDRTTVVWGDNLFKLAPAIPDALLP